MEYKVNARLGRKIARLRKTMKLSQEKLAHRAGIHRTYMGKIERGESNPPIHTISKISAALKMPLNELFK